MRQSVRPLLDLPREEFDVVVDIPHEYRVQHEHDVVDEPDRVDLILVYEDLRGMPRHDLQDAEHVHYHREGHPRALQDLLVVAVFELLEYHEDLGGELIHGVEERVHELLGDLVPALQELLADLPQEVLRVRVLDPDLRVPQRDLLEPTAFREPQEVLRHEVHGALVEGAEEHGDKVLLRVVVALEESHNGRELKEEVQTRQVDLLEVGVWDPSVDEMPRDEFHQLERKRSLILSKNLRAFFNPI